MLPITVPLRTLTTRNRMSCRDSSERVIGFRCKSEGPTLLWKNCQWQDRCYRRGCCLQIFCVCYLWPVSLIFIFWSVILVVYHNLIQFRTNFFFMVDIRIGIKMIYVFTFATMHAATRPPSSSSIRLPFVQSSSHQYISTSIHSIYMRAYIYAYLHTQINTYIQTNIHTLHICIHTGIRAYIPI